MTRAQNSVKERVILVDADYVHEDPPSRRPQQEGQVVAHETFGNEGLHPLNYRGTRRGSLEKDSRLQRASSQVPRFSRQCRGFATVSCFGLFG